MQSHDKEPRDRVALIARTSSRARSLRQDATFPERLLWGRLRQRPGGLKFRRQHPVGHFIVDFCCVERRVVIELDGRSHIGMQDADTARQQWIESQGYRVVRFGNDEVLNDLDRVVRSVLDRCVGGGDDCPSPGHAEA